MISNHHPLPSLLSASVTKSQKRHSRSLNSGLLSVCSPITPFVASLLILGNGSPVFAQMDVSTDLEIIRANHHMPGLSAIVVKQGRIIAQGAAGVRREGQNEKLLVTDPVNIGSCTKWMTATIAGRLIDRGLISWTTRIRDLFPNYRTFNAAFHEITLDQLLAHRAGVQKGTTFENNHWTQLMARNGSVTEIRRWVSETVMRDGPEVTAGEYLYSNQGITVAATMLEIVSGKPWETLIREEVFGPIRMRSAFTGIVYNDALPPASPVGHDLKTGRTVPVPRAAMSAGVVLRYQASNGAGGYVACTLQDWAKFLHVQLTSDVSDYFTPATASRLHQSFIGAEGYGRGIYALYRNWATPGQALTHSGDIWGEDSVFWMAPARDFLVAVFTNCRSEDSSTALAMDAAASLLTGRYSGVIVSAAGPWLEVPEILSLRREADDLVLHCLTLPGVSYIVDTSRDLTAWLPSNGTAGQRSAGLLTSWTESIPSAVRKFFRIRTIP